MLDKQSLNIDVKPNAPNFIVYAESKTPRLQYVCEFIFNHALNVNVVVTDNWREFQASPYFKINYSQKPCEGVFQINPKGILFQKTVFEKKPEAVFKNDMIYFFEHDVFAAVFYFISRYEEWQSVKLDVHRRFEVRQSLLFQHKFHLKPVVDSWILELKNTLQNFYPEINFPEKNFKAISTIDVDNLFAFKHKGFLRTLGASAKDIFKADFKNLSERISVLIGKKKDPFDIYEDVSKFCLDNNIPLFFFFLFKTGTNYDRTVNPQSSAFQNVFQILKKNKANIGIHPSYNSAYEKKLMKEEINLLAEKSEQKINFSRQHYLRFNIRTTPNLLIKKGIIADFTMGFASSVGFRAGTSLPFYYYDFNAERKNELLFVPFCAMDGAYFVYNKLNAETAFNSLLNLANEIKKVNGNFITVFHERTFSARLYPDFGSLYKKIYLKLKEGA
ncbi:MAG: polysaccharide deacetylase family protein [Bacteroidetes bacterium]|nr:polysaccharide deacetylase family protein [Bacteroidota bacterium]